MSDLRALIRELLSEEIASLRAEILGQSSVEHVAVGNEAELTAFALRVAGRVSEQGFVEALKTGRIRFTPANSPTPVLHKAPLAGMQPLPAAEPAMLVATAPPSVPELRKGLVTERDIAAVAQDETRLRLMKTARLTPLAADEVRRRRLRIERTLV